MDLACVDKLAEANNGVKYLLVPQDLFDRTVDAKGMKQKIQRNGSSIFAYGYKKECPEKLWVEKGTKFAGEPKKTMQSWRNVNSLYNQWYKGCICWTYNTIPEKIYFTITWKTMDTSTFTNWLISLPH